MTTRIYYVVNKAGDERLVEAATPAQAVRHAAQHDYTVAVASQKRCIDMGQGGFKVEKAGAPPDDLVTRASGPVIDGTK